MPRPRFAKLSQEKQERILEAAAKQFAAFGYENASLNQILAEAGISKGAAYYYFDDKADLYAAAIQHYTALLASEPMAQLGELTTTTFWPRLAEQYRQQFATARDKPWAFGLVKSAGRVAPETLMASGVAALITQLQSWLQAIIQQGQTLGVIRTDLPEPLLMSLFMTVDDALDQWLLQNWDNLDETEVNDISQKVLDGLRKLLEPEK